VILIDATYINRGGGLGLLCRLLTELRGRGDFAVLRDIRVTDLDTAGFKVHDAVPRLAARRRFYRKHGADFSRVLCFGNVPPPVRLPVPTATYFHNLLFCENYAGEGWREHWLTALKMAYIRWHAANTDVFLVQSANMKAALRAKLGGKPEISIVPFFATARGGFASEAGREWDQFAYVSEAHPHKNHHRLLEAWRLLLARGLRPGLHLTVTSAYPEVLAKIAALQSAGARITNHGYAQPAPIYARCGYQIYPSLVESFGLGLIEAADARCAVLAADRPYVRAVVDPHAFFDPLSPAAIAELVALCAGQPAPASVPKVEDELAGLAAWLSEGTPFREEQS
jgi:glycosyltransferase involved in cell wall biosynthesis